jgi:hypothetical protein
MDGQCLESTVVSSSGNIESDVMMLLATTRSCAASWMKEHVLSLARSEPIIRNGNGIAKKLLYIFETAHMMNDTDFYPSPGYLDFSVLADCTPEAQAAVLQTVCRADLYGHAAKEAMKYAQENGIRIAA